MSVKKQYLKTKQICKVTFSIPKEIANSAGTVHLVGDFNDWSPVETAMKRRKDGSITATLDLKPDREYAFRYLLDGTTWENDPQADKYVRNEYGSENSVIVV
jgi:1,4-alpha-glucan branching enzyme